MNHPTLFISHGAPNTILYESQTKDNLHKLSHLVQSAKYIIAFSAHWTTHSLEVINPETNKLMYDFSGFEQALFEYQYDIKSDNNYTLKVLDALDDFNPSISPYRDSFDHGVWSALALITPTIQIPVIQISVPMSYSPTLLFELGKTLQGLKDEALIISSGALTHNLYQAQFHSQSIAPYAQHFNDEIVEIVKNGDMKKLLDFKNILYFKENHPTIEHFLPLLIAAGASKNHQATSVNSEFTHYNISMESFIFKG
ncbi:MAG: class III extradiol ring-cleavage dioxygenase [Arcobacteraceae bacterium]